MPGQSVLDGGVGLTYAGWVTVLGDKTVAAAMLDRLLHGSVVLNSTDIPTAYATTTHARKSSAKPPPEPANHYSEHRSRVMNFAEHNC